MTTPMATSILIKRFNQVYPTPSLHSHIWQLLKALSPLSRTNTAIFHFRPTPDLSELSKLQVSVRCRHASQYIPPEQYDIDLNTLQISGATSDHATDPGDILSVEATDAAMELRKYANNLLTRMQKYRDSLIQLGVITDSSPFLQVDLLTCPLCHRRLESCADCDAVVACPNQSCLASAATEGQWCDDDRRAVFSCRQCLDTKGLDATLVQCPTCQLWRYSPTLDWCFGRITSNSEELVGLPESDRESIKRSHPRKPGPCSSCAGVGVASRWKRCNGDVDVCPSKLGRPSHFRLHGSYCPDCVAEIRGRGCVCGFIWTCDVCAEDQDRITSLLYTSCPRCRRTYCFFNPGCEYCRICRTCKKPGLCDDCVEEEDTLEEEKTSPVTFVDRCDQCRGLICATCSPHKLMCCVCKDRVCGSCVVSRHDTSCDIPICLECADYSDHMVPSPPKSGEEQDVLMTG